MTPNATNADVIPKARMIAPLASEPVKNELWNARFCRATPVTCNRRGTNCGTIAAWVGCTMAIVVPSTAAVAQATTRCIRPTCSSQAVRASSAAIANEVQNTSLRRSTRSAHTPAGMPKNRWGRPRAIPPTSAASAGSSMTSHTHVKRAPPKINDDRNTEIQYDRYDRSASTSATG